MQRPAESELVYLERLRSADREPWALERAWLPRSIAGPLPDADCSHSGLCDEVAALTGTRLTGGHEVITALVPDAATRQALAIPPGCAAMEVRRTGCLRDRPWNGARR